LSHQKQKPGQQHPALVFSTLINLHVLDHHIAEAGAGNLR
jgi:hypothetical protein